MTNQEAHEQAAGMGLDDAFFAVSGIDPDAEYPARKPFERCGRCHMTGGANFGKCACPDGGIPDAR